MKKFLVAAVLLFTCGAFAEGTTATAEPFKLIHVNDLSAMMESKTSKTFVFDANNKQVRTKDGIIPGAKILSSSDKYNIAKTLPSDKASSLVFYCANEACTASHNAAKRAIGAGYTNVSVLADGIKGWKDAGKATTKYAPKKS